MIAQWINDQWVIAEAHITVHMLTCVRRICELPNNICMLYMPQIQPIDILASSNKLIYSWSAYVSKGVCVWRVCGFRWAPGGSCPSGLASAFPGSRDLGGSACTSQARAQLGPTPRPCSRPARQLETRWTLSDRKQLNPQEGEIVDLGVCVRNVRGVDEGCRA